MEAFKSSLIVRFFIGLGAMFQRGMIAGFFSSTPKDAPLRASLLYQGFQKFFAWLEKGLQRVSGKLAEKTEQSILIHVCKTLLLHLLSFNTRFYVTTAFIAVLITFLKGHLVWKLVAAVLFVIFTILDYTPANNYKSFILTKVLERIFGEEIDVGTFQEENLIKSRFAYAVVLGVLLGIAGSYKMLLAPLALIGIFGFLLVMWKYEVGVFALVFAAPIAPTMVCAGLAVLTLLSLLCRIFLTGKFTLPMEGVSFFIMLLLLLFAFYTVTSLTPVKSLQIFVLYVIFILGFFFVTSAGKSKKSLYWLAACFVMSGFVVALYGIYQQVAGVADTHAWVDEDMFGSIARVYSTLDNPNVLGEYLLLCIPLAIGLMWTRKIFISRLFYFGVLCSMLLCLVFTQSRGCWLGFFLVAAIYVLFVERRLIPLGILAVLALPFVMPDSIIERFSSIGNLGDSSTSYRVFIWLGTMAMLRDYGIFGIGLGISTFSKVYPFYSYSNIIAPHSHNLYLQLLTETGVSGLVLLLAVVFIAFRKYIYTFVSRKKDLAGIIAVSVLAGLCGFLLQGAFDYVWYNYRVFLTFWLFLAIGMAAYRVRCEDD